jgi:hypothetical protein
VIRWIGDTAKAFRWIACTLIWGNPEWATYEKEAEPPKPEVAPAIRDDITLCALVTLIVAGAEWINTRLVGFGWPLDWRRAMIISWYVIAIVYLQLRLRRTRKPAERFNSIPYAQPDPAPPLVFVYRQWDRGLLRVCLALTIGLFAVYLLAGADQAPVARIVSWAQRRPIPGQFKPPFKVLARLPYNGMLLAQIEFEFDPAFSPDPVALIAQLTDAARKQYKLGKMNAKIGDKALDLEHSTAPEAILEVERRLIFDAPSEKKKCLVIVRIAARRPDDKLLATAEADPWSLIELERSVMEQH